MGRFGAQITSGDPLHFTSISCKIPNWFVPALSNYQTSTQDDAVLYSNTFLVRAVQISEVYTLCDPSKYQKKKKKRETVDALAY